MQLSQLISTMQYSVLQYYIYTVLLHAQQLSQLLYELLHDCIYCIPG